jgi:hypothetical protein
VLGLLKTLTQVTSYTLRGRILVVKLRVTLFQVNKLMHKLVELYIGYDGSVLDIVQVIVFMQQLAQLYYPFCFAHF